MRLTRRGRMALLGVLTAPVVLGVLLSATGPSSGPRAGAPVASYTSPPAATVVVQPGDTLWSLAARAVPDEDPRETLARIVEINHLPSARVRAGQRLVLPTSH